jgi:hypothetical protein
MVLEIIYTVKFKPSTDDQRFTHTHFNEILSLKSFLELMENLKLKYIVEYRGRPSDPSLIGLDGVFEYWVKA